MKKTIVILCLVNALYCSDACGYDNQGTHQRLILKSSEMFESLEKYKEELSNDLFVGDEDDISGKDSIVEGAFAEDVDKDYFPGNLIENTFRLGAPVVDHFNHPVTGRGLYFLPILELPLLEFKSSVEKANEFTWPNAINKYGYSDAEKKNAYFWLGRTVHFVQDMGVPAHTHLDAHVILGMAGFEGFDHYEFFIEGSNISAAGTKIQNLPSMELFFNALGARVYNFTKYQANLPSITPFSLLEPTGELAEMFPDLGDQDRGLHVVVDSIVPFSGFWEIDQVGIYDPDIELLVAENDWWPLTARKGQSGYYYLEKLFGVIPAVWKGAPNSRPLLEIYKEKFIPWVIEYGAGLMKFYHDIVNHPPYLSQLNVQMGDESYIKRWEYFIDNDELGNTTGRHREMVDLADNSDSAIFGGDQNKGNDKDGNRVLPIKLLTTFNEPVSEESLFASIGLHRVNEAKKVDGELGKTWELTVNVPTKPDFNMIGPHHGLADGGVAIYIEAKDLNFHRLDNGEIVEGIDLDSFPETVAIRRYDSGSYSWKGYEFGGDIRHRITIDTQPPNSPSLSSSQSIGSWTNNRNISFDISSSDNTAYLTDFERDNGYYAGLDGFSFEWNQSGNITSDTFAKNKKISASDGELIKINENIPGNGEWYFYVRPVDKVGNWGGLSRWG